MIRILSLVAALLLLAFPAQAVSFDCAKASSSFEKAICADPEISHQDDILAQAYATALGGLSKPAADDVHAGQMGWLGYAERVCSDDAQPIEGTYTAEQRECLAGVFRSRIRDLEVSRMWGGYRFYPLDRYSAAFDTESPEGSFSRVANKHIQAIRIDRTDATSTAFNAMVDDILTELVALDPDTGAIAAGTVSSDNEITIAVSEVNARRISLATTQYWYDHGAAHGGYFITHQHFLVPEQRRLVAEDIFTGDWQPVLGDLALAAIKAQRGEDYFGGSDEDVAAIAIDPLRWDFADDGLVVQFNIYEVTAYAGGAPTTTIHWDDLADVLTDEARGIAAGY